MNLLTVAVLLADPAPVWNWHDKAAWGFNIGLVVSGIVGIIIAVYTLKAIRRQVEIANKTLIAQFRPRLHIRRMRVIETEDSLTLEAILVNRGDTTGRVTSASIRTAWNWRTRQEKSDINTTTFESFELLPGESAPLKVNLHDAWVLYRYSANDAEERRGQIMMLECAGEINYLDDNETQREIGFSRLWNHETERFVASADPEEEYAD